MYLRIIDYVDVLVYFINNSLTKSRKIHIFPLFFARYKCLSLYLCLNTLWDHEVLPFILQKQVFWTPHVRRGYVLPWFKFPLLFFLSFSFYILATVASSFLEVVAILFHYCFYYKSPRVKIFGMY